MFSRYFNTYKAAPLLKKEKIEPKMDLDLNQDNNVLDLIQPFPWLNTTNDSLEEPALESDELFDLHQSKLITSEWKPSWVLDDIETQESEYGQELSLQTIDDIIATGRSCIGLPYKSGGTSPKTGMDCSGFLYYIFNANGIKIDRSTYAFQKMGKEVSLNEARPGDIIVTPGSGKSGLHVKMISRITSDGKIFTLEAKGREDGIDEFELENTNNIKTIRRVLNTTTKYTLTGIRGKFNNKKDFVKELNSLFRKSLSNKGLDPNYSYTLVAQAALESGWGKHLAGNFNFGGIKISNKEAAKHPEKSRRVMTTDYIKGEGYKKHYLNFRNFSSLEEYCNYKIDLLSNRRYNAFNSVGSSNPYNFIFHILSRGYGSDYGGPESRKYTNLVMKNYNDILNILKT